MKQCEEKDRLDKIIGSLAKTRGSGVKIAASDALFLCQASLNKIQAEPNILELRAPLCVCGDVHGQFVDLLQIFTLAEYPPATRYLFLGDYVDRGTQSLEVICLLLALKLRYPNHIFLIRGNHETREMTEQYGFLVECSSKLNKAIYNEFIKLFDALPLAAIINERIFCIHGGLTPDLHSLDQIKNIPRPTKIEEHGFLADLVWSDPSIDVEEWAPNDRGLTVRWGFKPAKLFMESNHLTHIVRAHQMAENGVDYPFEPERSVITVFSAPWYAGEFKNLGAFLRVDKSLRIEVVLLTHDFNGPQTTFATTLPNDKGGNKHKKDTKGKGKR